MNALTHVKIELYIQLLREKGLSRSALNYIRKNLEKAMLKQVQP
jgi:5-bromo-4-chloroindolyl phosphate hydrolysis protein